MWEKISWKFKELGSILIAVIRFIILLISIFFGGLQIILFQRTEIAMIDLRGCAWRCDCENDVEKLSLIDKLTTENPDLTTQEDINIPKEDDDSGEED